MKLNALKGRSVLLTGHTGFKGSWLCHWLDMLGAEVHGYSLEPDTEPSLFRAAHLEKSLASHTIADVRDREALRVALDSSDPELIIHMAAQPLVRLSYREPLETFDTNFMGTVNLLESIRLRRKPCAVLVVTTDKCYRNEEQVWGYREMDPLGGDDPYSASKAAAELAVHSYRRSFFGSDLGVRLASARGGNVIGGGDWSLDRIVPDLVRALSEGEQLEVRSPKAIRPWQHVLELLYGYLRLSEKLLTEDVERWCSAWNFGPTTGQDVPVGQLVDIFCETWGDGTWKDVSDPNQLHEANLLRLSIDKSVSELNWLPTWSVREAVERTARWYKRFVDGQDASALMTAEIKDFERD